MIKERNVPPKEGITKFISPSFMHHTYTPHEIKLATEIAETLGDRDSMALHLMYVRKYQEAFLREKLVKVMAMPEHKIKKSRAAIYVFLINQHSQHGGAGD